MLTDSQLRVLSNKMAKKYKDFMNSFPHLPFQDAQKMVFLAITKEVYNSGVLDGVNKEVNARQIAMNKAGKDFVDQALDLVKPKDE